MGASVGPQVENHSNLQQKVLKEQHHGLLDVPLLNPLSCQWPVFCARLLRLVIGI